MRLRSSSVLSVIVALSPSCGHLKCPRSNLLKYIQKPFSSHVRIFSLSRFLLQNTNRAFSKGSSLKLFSTIAESPLMDLRISVFPQARYTGISGMLSITASPSAILFLTAPYPLLPRYLCGLFQFAVPACFLLLSG